MEQTITGPFHICEGLENGGDGDTWFAHATTKYAALQACVYLFSLHHDACLHVLDDDYDRAMILRASDITPAMINAANAVELKERVIQLHQELAHAAMRLGCLVKGSGFLIDATYADAIKTAQASVSSLLEDFENGARYELTTDGLMWIRGTGAGTMYHVVSGGNEGPNHG